MGIARGIHRIVDAQREVERAQGLARDVVYLTVQECAQCGVHRERVGVAVGHIHSSGQQRYSQFAPVLGTHALQLFLQLLVLGIEDELKAHVVKRLGDYHAALEGLALPYSLVVRHGCLHYLRCRDVKPRVHGVAGELNIAAFLDGEGLQRDDGQRVFHLAVVERILSAQLQLVHIIILHAQGAAAHEVDEV